MRTSDTEIIDKVVATTGETPISKRLSFEKGEIHYFQVGNPSLPALVAVHGSPGSADNMLHLMTDTFLLKRFQIIAVDRLGFGFSQYGKTETSLAKHAAEVHAIMKTLGDVPKYLLGHSFGGPVIVRAAIDYPQEVDGLCIIAGSVDPDLEPHPWWQKPINSKSLRWILPAPLRVSNQEIIPLRHELEVMEPLWLQIECPVFIMQGTLDNLVPVGNAAFAEARLQHVPFQINRYRGADHFILWSMPDEIHRGMLWLLNAATVNP